MRIDAVAEIRRIKEHVGSAKGCDRPARVEAQFHEDARTVIADAHVAGDATFSQPLSSQMPKDEVVSHEISLDQTIAKRMDFDPACLEIRQRVRRRAADVPVVADDIPDDADKVGVPSGDSALRCP